MPTRLEIDWKRWRMGWKNHEKMKKLMMPFFFSLRGLLDDGKLFFCAPQYFRSDSNWTKNLAREKRVWAPHTPPSNFLPRLRACVSLSLAQWPLHNDSSIPKCWKTIEPKPENKNKQQNSRRCFKTFFFFRFLLCPVSWPCLLFSVSKFSGARNLIQDFFYDFCFCLLVLCLIHSVPSFR